MKIYFGVVAFLCLISTANAANVETREGYGSSSDTACKQAAERLKVAISNQRQQCVKSGRTFVAFPDTCEAKDVSKSFGGKPQWMAARKLGWVCE